MNCILSSMHVLLYAAIALKKLTTGLLVAPDELQSFISEETSARLRGAFMLLSNPDFDDLLDRALLR
jgi:hypothetical protein